MCVKPAARLRTRHRVRGFTLVELMITIAIAAILLMLAIPGFQRLILSNRLNTAAGALVNAMNIARINAIKLNASTQFCGSTTASNAGDALGKACGTLAGAVYSLPQSAGTAGQVQAVPPSIYPPVQFSGAGVTAVRFSGQGYGYAPGVGSNTPFQGTVATLCTSQLPSANQRIVSMSSGSVIATASSTGACP